MRRLIRLFVVATIALAAWVVSAPAWAATTGNAGLCSEWGTSEVAPAPLMMPAQESLEQGDAPYCEVDWRDQVFQRGDDRAEPAPVPLVAVLPSRTLIARAASIPAALTSAADGERIGFTFELERPPRA